MMRTHCTTNYDERNAIDLQKQKQKQKQKQLKGNFQKIIE
jgi:hypothetical protein